MFQLQHAAVPDFRHEKGFVEMAFRTVARIVLLLTAIDQGFSHVEAAEMFQLQLRAIEANEGKLARSTQAEAWQAAETAVIVCDVWDYHHCLNAVRRLEEFAPRLDQVLKAARDKGAIIIHAPSDCMPAYVDHPARKRAMQVPPARPMPANMEAWCSRLQQESEVYPIDQSDGGEDDDASEHAAWAEKLKQLGRNPGMPWKKQSDLISIDGTRDYISDRGDEVWSILEQRGIRNVILTGVHCNMCVLGRPFGLRQMVRNGKHVVLMRDLTDSMYSPRSWPFVDHFTGHDLVIRHVERFVCPTITSDQILGGCPFRWQSDLRDANTVDQLDVAASKIDLKKHWATVDITGPAIPQALKESETSVWHRGAWRITEKSLAAGPLVLRLPRQSRCQVWINGREVPSHRSTVEDMEFEIPRAAILVNDYNILVVRSETSTKPFQPLHIRCHIAGRDWEFERFWQVRIGNDARNTNIPLPAKFGIGPDAVLQLKNWPEPF